MSLKVLHTEINKEMVRYCLPYYLIRHCLHVANFYRYKKYVSELEVDLANETDQYLAIRFCKDLPLLKQLYCICWAFAYDPFFVTLFYWRLKGGSQYLRLLKRDDSSLHLYCNEIGKNFQMVHPFSTIINAKKIGDNVTIRNNTTIGDKGDDPEQRPIIGNNVDIGPNSIIFGGITIGNNVVIGAGTLINKDVPDNSIVVGNPFRFLKKGE